MNKAPSTLQPTRAVIALVLSAGLACSVIAQQVPPAPPAPEPAPAAPAPAPRPPEITDALGRRIIDNQETVLAFPKATVEQVIPFIAESTGKVIIPQQEILARRISVINDKPIPRKAALDMLFFALQQAGVAVIENPDFILLRDQADIDRQPVPVVGPGNSTLDRTDLGAIVQKVFSLKHASAPNVAEIVKTSLPDNANKIIADADSSQVIVTAPVAILQRIERTIIALDRPPPDLPRSETFQLRFADAESVAGFIRELYGDASTRSTRTNAGSNQGGGGQGGGQGRPQQQGNRPAGGGGAGGGAGGLNPNEGGSGARAQATPVSSILRVTANLQQNAVTVLAESAILKSIRDNVENEWDKPLPAEVVTPRVFDLKYTDPIKIRIVLEGLFGTGTTGGGARQTAGRLAGQFTFQAVPEAGRLIVVGTSSDNIQVIERIIASLDRPMTSGLPDVIELKHVQAEDLAEQLNALLAQDGTFAQIRRVSTDLSSNTSQASPFAASTGAQFDTNTFARDTPTDVLSFWWQRSRPATDNFGASNLVAKARIVPIAKSNSVLVLAPLEYRASIAELIARLDKPGRQVLISAIIAEISTDDALSLGIRFSSAAINPSRIDNAIGVANDLDASKNNIFPGLFDTSVLNVGINLNALLQALSEKQKVKILSEPRIFTGDNQEATFFDGQDIPFITDSEQSTSGNLVQSFDYRAVGINLRVRPRITPERDVDLKVNLELASIQPQQTLFGGYIIDRRETTTQLIVGDGQTVVISGIMRAEDSDIKRKIPLLGDIPLIGPLFTSTERSTTNTELIAFITPVVVLNGKELTNVNQAPRDRLNQLRGELAPTQPKPDQTPEPSPTTSPTTTPTTTPQEQTPP